MQITDKALQKIKVFLSTESSEKVFKITVTSGGCSGFSYKTEIILPTSNDLQLFDRIVTDEVSSSFLGNVTMDYKDEVGFSGFVFNNPDATSTCGCGMSFDY